jgi:Ala-tRNA(Pro) deacylase
MRTDFSIRLWRKLFIPFYALLLVVPADHSVKLSIMLLKARSLLKFPTCLNTRPTPIIKKRLEICTQPFSMRTLVKSRTLLIRTRRFMASAPAPPVEEVETPETHHKVITKLESAGLVITKSHHAPAKTSEEAAQIRGFPLECGAKAIVMSVKLKATTGETCTFVLFVMSATHKLDSKKARKIVTGCKSMSFATPDQVKTLTGCIPGAVPPFGSIWSIQTYMDTSLRKVGEFIDFNAGLRTDSVRMRQEDYETVEQPIVSDFTVPP